MRTAALLALVVLVSGCVSFGGALSGFSLTPQKSVTLVEDLRISAEAAPDEILENRTSSLFFEFENRGNTTLRNVSFAITDSCILTAQGNTSKSMGSLEPGETEFFETVLRAPELDLSQSCTIRYATTYQSNTSLRTDIAVVSDEELTRLSRRGERSDIRIFETETRGPVDIELIFSKEQPLPSGTDFFAYIKLADAGTGGVGRIAPGHLTVKYPDRLVVIEACDDLAGSNGTLTNAREVTFQNRETKTMTCRFRTGGESIISDVDSFEADAQYIYTIRGSLQVTITPE